VLFLKHIFTGKTGGRVHSTIEKAYAKINLALHIEGRRPDGYHLLSMVMQTVDLYDSIEIRQLNDTSDISMDMDFGGRDTDENISCGGDNLCVKAARLICSELPESHGYHMHLVKNIPSAAGMAGGSSDAAAVLRGINKLEGGYFPKKKLLEMAVKLGADVPFCIDGGLCVCKGIGEILTPIESKFDPLLLLAKPYDGVSTPAAYKYFDENPVTAPGHFSKLVDGLRSDDHGLILSNLHNDLEDASKHFCPVISQIEDVMMRNGALAAKVTGSGPTVYGIFENEDDRAGASKELQAASLAADIISTGFIRPDYQ